MMMGQSQENQRSGRTFQKLNIFACVIANVASNLYMFLNFQDKKTIVDRSVIGATLR